MTRIHLITGGCRSGKSAHALRRAHELNGTVAFFATCVPGDDPEMQSRVAAHRAERPQEWRLIEEAYNLLKPLARVQDEILILDCVPTWLGNLLVRCDSEPSILSAVNDLVTALNTCPAKNAIVVSAEVGEGLVPETKLGRTFRDLVGTTNQKLAAAAQEVTLMVAGIPVKIR